MGCDAAGMDSLLQRITSHPTYESSLLHRIASHPIPSIPAAPHLILFHSLPALLRRVASHVMLFHFQPSLQHRILSHPASSHPCCITSHVMLFHSHPSLLNRIPCYAIPFPSIPAESHPIPTHRSQPSLLHRIASCPTLIHPCCIASHPVLLSSTPAAPCPTPCQPCCVASHPILDHCCCLRSGPLACAFSQCALGMI